MNMNMVVNMLMRLVMRRVLNKGIDAGIKGATGMARKRRGPQQPLGEIDDYGNPTRAGQRAPTDTSERDRIRAARRASRAARD